MGRSPRIMPSLLDLPNNAPIESINAHKIIRQTELDCDEAQDNLLLAKVSQAIQADKSRGPDPSFKVGDFVMLNTLHRRCEYSQ